MSGEKNARACDSCIGKRARWYCAADDAFLCQSCDASVHSANPLARRHERVRLKVGTNTKGTEIEGFEDVSVPSWLQGFTRKARSPRKPPGKLPAPEPNRGVSVPELGSGETSQEDNEDELGLYMVPIYDPFEQEPAAPRNAAHDAESKEVKALLAGFGQDDVDDMDGILPSEEDLAVFAADVESLLGGEIHGMEGPGMTWHSTLDVKTEEGDLAFHAGNAYVDFDHDPPEEKSKKILLNLDYESVIMAWASQRSPWTTGCRPELRAGEECWPEIFLDRHVHGGMGGRVMSQQAMGGREARVTRYREKRRTRLFSKKIRYEVRKLNAEKRPRMKGRFVKRAQIVNVPLLDV